MARPPSADRVQIVKRIFQLALDGIGKQKIASMFNQEGVPTFGKSKDWHPSYIQKVLNNEAVIGRYQPMKLVNRKRVPDGPVIDDYFPAVVDLDTFIKAKHIRESRKIGGGRKGKKFSNLFTGMAVCGVCQAPMHFINKGGGLYGGTYLVCSNARRKAQGCKSHSWRYMAVQSAIVSSLDFNEIDFRQLFPTLYKSAQSALREAEDRLLVKTGELQGAMEDREKVVNLLLKHLDSAGLNQKLDQLDKTVDTLKQDFAELNRMLAERTDSLHQVSPDGYAEMEDAFKRMLKAEEHGDDKELFLQRSKLHQLYKRCIRKIELIPGYAVKPTAADHDNLFHKIHGIIEIKFQGVDDYFRRIYIEKGQQNAHGYKVMDDKEDHHTSSIGLCWPPDGVIYTGMGLESVIFSSGLSSESA